MPERKNTNDAGTRKKTVSHADDGGDQGRRIIPAHDLISLKGTGRPVAGSGLTGFDISDETPQGGAKSKSRRKKVLVKDYGCMALCHHAGSGIMQELMRFWPSEDARMLYAMALLLASSDEAVLPGLSLAYETSFVSELYQGLDLSAGAVTAFLERTGQDESRIIEFMKWRADAYGKGGLIIDGMLRRSDHEPDDLPEDVLMSGLCPAPLRLGVMYAWSMEEDEPAALQPYPGSLLDDSLAASFMGELFISNGIMFLDKGFWTDVLYRDTPVYGDITYILPLDPGSQAAERYKMLHFDSQIARHHGAPVLGKKEKTKSSGFLYSFNIAGMSPADYAASFQLSKDRSRFGGPGSGDRKPLSYTFCFKSKADLNLRGLYELFIGREEREDLINERGSFPVTAAWNDESYSRAMGAELVNFLRSVISARVRNLLIEKLPEKNLTEKEAFRLLSKCRKVRTAGKGDWNTAVMPEPALKLAEALGLEL